ncbi:MAG TPA: serine/threonine-protein kinase, partial [Kofleriaceae bacterium]|nr:serine/threonine-protein kinase [Kofleriaceae bacterium]
HHAHLPNKRYAVKVLLGDHSASTAMRTRFTREAERASQLDHPNVVKVVDFGQTRHGLLYIVMDYVEGPSLVALIGETPIPPGRAIALARGICKGLIHAHAAGLVHRDLKPENILVSTGPDGEVPRIVDFGLAMSLEAGDARLTESGMTMGTPAFAAPEQISGKPIDHRADLYALGMSMFEMLTGGMPPFEGHMMEMVSARTTRDAPRISERAPGLEIPRELDDIVAQLTRRKPSDRFTTARDVIDALDRVRLGPEARIPTEPLQIVRPRRGGRIALGLAAIGGLALAAAFLVPADRGAFAAWPVSGGAATLSQSDESAAVASSDDDDSGEPPGSSDRVAPVDVPAPARPAEAAAPAVSAPAASLAASVERPARPPVRATPIKHRNHQQRESRERAARPAVRIESAPAVALPPAGAQPPVPAAPRELRAQIDGVEVSGSLPPGEVQRAIERRSQAIQRCAPAAPATVVARFTIGEARRAHAVRAAGPTAQTNACVAAALSDVRTEAAPDIGEVEVTVRIAFVVKT